jgi:phenylacetaldehyde dehydrogenase
MTVAIQRPPLSSAAAKFLAKELKLFIDGKWVAAKSGKTFPVEDPATEETIAHAPAGDKADIDLAVAAARRAFEFRPPKGRGSSGAWATFLNNTSTSSPNSRPSITASR